KIQILGIGKVREQHYKEGIQFYLKRLGSYCSVQIREVTKEKSGSESSLEEAYGSLKKQHMSAEVRVALDQRGESMTSKEFAVWMQKVTNKGVRRVSFLLGGPHGLPDSAISDSSEVLSMSSMTLPHQMARLLLLEQIYRAFTIMRGEPYHK
ncbi:23S rRNA (pseudouridine(1915)-N(3))-methyltransferase RlmH, partial [bacterium]